MPLNKLCDPSRGFLVGDTLIVGAEVDVTKVVEAQGGTVVIQPNKEGVPEAGPSKSATQQGRLSSCAICLDAPIEGACIPCGHMPGCMSCLSNIEVNSWGCPICRAKIQKAHLSQSQTLPIGCISLLAQVNEGVIAPITLTNSITPLFVSDLTDSTTRKWRSNIIYHCWPEDIAKQIISIPLSLSANPDERIWTLSVNGKYTVKSGYHALHSTNTTPLFDWRIIWKLKCPPRVKVFMWKLSRDALKSSSNLFRFGLNINPDRIFFRTTTRTKTTPLS
ncbi:hypothetical protein IFM89_000318 [Coptis chinensis]|uniref:RING-type domain-containing protein n=1 Tax=Coptis chinensis TaxID=261450 RepID=A0A835H828_9MAGN|nr:hypothetical protein IFM89_000318 [Coptis chinensis]